MKSANFSTASPVLSAPHTNYYALTTNVTDLAIVILTKDEKLHIKRCLERLAPLEPRQVFVVDCFSTDGTQENVRLSSVVCPLSSHLSLVEHEWPGLQSVQFNWALDNLPVEAKWILRIDADEYLTDESIEWLKENLDGIDEKVDALEFTLERKFMGGAIRHGTNGIQMVRMFRRERGRYAETLMDERMVFDGEKLSVPVVFYDDNLNSLEWWKEKHRGYAKREAQQAMESLKSGVWTDPRKARYYKLPPYFRALAYFCVRYFLKLGFLDGAAGFRWHFWQGLWYRWLVDREISILKSSNPSILGKQV
ncbi:MAG: glycosyltransferase family 2 protein [Kiritimatiellae bacterium]|nr:glycosyltransferase family 2 protein [Kiritimatiellia bacterium]